MKKVFYIIAALIFFQVINYTKANPIATYYLINEFSIDTSGWKMELYVNYPPQDSISLDGWFITSKIDTAFFNEGIYFNQDGYVVVTNNDLKKKLLINMVGDTISLFSSDTLLMDNLIFGNIGCPVLCPKPGQSICKGFIPAPFSDIPFWYLDNSPTFGFPNDTLNVKGYVEGFIKDANGNPVENVTVLYSYIRDYKLLLDSSFVITNVSGYFKFRNYAKISRVYFKKEDFKDSSIALQVWPDSIVTLPDVKLIMGIIEEIPSNIIIDYNLTQNFPNPFNNSTSFFYTLPKGNYVDIKIYDQKGALVQKIFSGYQSAGKYKVNWNADRLASGVYIYQVKIGSFNLNKKAILLK